MFPTEEQKEIQLKIQKIQKALMITKKLRDAIKKELAEKEPVFLRQIKALESDLKVKQAMFDSINALHTQEVGKLAKYTGE